jgi:hypothetical protein
MPYVYIYIYIIAHCISTVKYQIAIKYQLLYTIIPGKYLRSRNLMWNPSDRGTWKHAFLLDLWPYSKPPAVEFPPNGTADEPQDFEVPQVGVGYQLFQTTQAATTSASDCPLYSMVISGTDLLEVPTIRPIFKAYFWENISTKYGQQYGTVPPY